MRIGQDSLQGFVNPRILLPVTPSTRMSVEYSFHETKTWSWSIDQLSNWCGVDCVKKCTHGLCVNYFCIAATKIAAPSNLRWDKFILALDLSFVLSCWEGMVAEACGGDCLHHARPASQEKDWWCLITFLLSPLLFSLGSFMRWCHPHSKWYSCFRSVETLLQACPEACLNLSGVSTIHPADSVDWSLQDPSVI